MKRIICILFILILITAVLVGCGGKEEGDIGSDEEARQAVSDISDDLANIEETLDEVTDDISGEEKS